MGEDRVLYYVTDRKGSRGEPLDDVGVWVASKAAGQQKYFGPFRNDKLTYGKYSFDEDGQPVLCKLDSADSIPIEADSNVFVFVHGFNSQFAVCLEVLSALESAINSGSMKKRKSAQSRDDVIFILYSWPSMGSPFAYMQDECTAQYSYAHFKKFMDEICSRVADRKQIHLVAHSLGCQFVYGYLMNEKAGKGKAAGTVVLSCPDLDYQTVSLEDARRKFSSRIERGYVLVSDVDGPLEISRALHGYTRLGRPAMSSAKSLFWGTFRTGSVKNILSTAAHAPEMFARRAAQRARGGDIDAAWSEANKDKGVAFAKNIQLYDFTLADRLEKSGGHTICVDLIASLFKNGSPPVDWTEETIVKMPDEFVECSIFPYSRTKPLEQGDPELFAFRKLTPATESLET